MNKDLPDFSQSHFNSRIPCFTLIIRMLPRWIYFLLYYTINPGFILKLIASKAIFKLHIFLFSHF